MKFKKEMDFDLDNFKKQKYLPSGESIASIILNLFFSKPGTFPSLPHIGLDINRYLYKHSDELDIDEIKDKLYNQCSELLPYLMLGNIGISIVDIEGNDVLMISIHISYEDDSETILYGFGKGGDGSIVYNYQNIRDGIK